MGNKSRTVSVEVNVGYVDVDIDLSEISTEDLIQELSTRGINEGVMDVGLYDIYKQFSFGNESRAIELTKKFIEDNMGRTLS